LTGIRHNVASPSACLRQAARPGGPPAGGPTRTPAPTTNPLPHRVGEPRPGPHVGCPTRSPTWSRATPGLRRWRREKSP